MSVFKISGKIGEEKETSLIERAKGILLFENELPLLHSSINKEFPISINDVKGIIATPRYPDEFPLDSKFSNLMSPIIYNLKIPKVYWGSIISWPKGECSVKTCCVKIESQNPINSTQVFLDIEAWYQRFLDNLTIISGYNVRGTQKVSTVAPIGDGKFELYSNDKRLWISTTNTLTINVPDRNKEYGISYEKLKEAIDVTSSGKKPLFEFYFFMDALEAFQHDNYRKAILDAATAFELGLNNVLMKKLPVEQNFKNEVLKNYNSLSKKRNLCKKLKIELPKYSYEKEFDEFRNHAIHIGRFPTRVEAKKALEIASEVLYKIIPDKFEIVEKKN